jgi:hypothetical protein
MPIENLVGLTLASAVGEIGGDRLILKSECGKTFTFEHFQDCCEDVHINDIVGDLQDLVGTPILVAEEVSSEDTPIPDSCEYGEWTFYKFATRKGYVDVRWLGDSNGYYGTGVDLTES